MTQGVNLLCREGNSLLGHWKLYDSLYQTVHFQLSTNQSDEESGGGKDSLVVIRGQGNRIVSDSGSGINGRLLFYSLLGYLSPKEKKG